MDFDYDIIEHNQDYKDSIDLTVRDARIGKNDFDGPKLKQFKKQTIERRYGQRTPEKLPSIIAKSVLKYACIASKCTKVGNRNLINKNVN